MSTNLKKVDRAAGERQVQGMSGRGKLSWGAGSRVGSRVVAGSRRCGIPGRGCAEGRCGEHVGSGNIDRASRVPAEVARRPLPRR